MKLRLLFVVCALLTSCGYHLVGQGSSTVIPDDVISANLSAVHSPSADSSQASDKFSQPLLAELTSLWENNEYLPSLRPERVSRDHVTVRVEQADNQFAPVAFDAAGLAIQYRMQVSAVLKLYQENTMIWQSGVVLVHTDVFGGSDPSVIEAERERLTEQLEQEWAKNTMSRLTSGF
jgi:outer membrane lipopolysaccharide assembly protein LptE/RlpB